MYNLLIADDKDVFRRMITRMPYFTSNQSRFRIRHLARNGLEALELLTTEEIDIVLTDIRMPHMNGIALLREINKRKLCRCTVLLSEYSDFSYAKEGIIHGAFDYILKPVADETLRETFDRAWAFMQSQPNAENLFQRTICRLATSLFTGNETLFSQQLTALADQIAAHGDSPAKQASLAGMALEELGKQVRDEWSFAADFIPIGLICSLDRSAAEMPDPIAAMRGRIRVLEGELRKFRIPSANPLIREIAHHIFTNIDTAPCLQDLARKIYLNKNYLSTLFKQETGLCYVDFITFFKMERAKMLTTVPALKIYDMAEMLGYASPEYFSKLFKRQTGFVPSAFDLQAHLQDRLDRSMEIRKTGPLLVKHETVLDVGGA